MNTYSPSMGESHATRETLSNRSHLYRDALETQLHEIRDEVTVVGKRIAVIGGAVVLGFALYRVLTRKSRHAQAAVRDAQEQAAQLAHQASSNGHTLVAPAIRSSNPLVETIKSAILSWLLAIAREQMINFLEQLSHKHAQPATGATAPPEEQKL
jgi:hypothetical protein